MEKEYVPPLLVGEKVSFFNPFAPELSEVPVIPPTPSNVAVPLENDVPVLGASPPKKTGPERDALLNGPPVCFSMKPKETELLVSTRKAEFESIK